MRAIILTSAMVLVMILGGCSTSRVAGPGVYYDDIYYVPGVSRDNVHDAFSPVPSLTREQEKEQSRALAARQNEYNRSDRAYAQQDMRDFSGVQEEYATILTDENIQDTDTLLYYNDETGYWVDGFQGSSMDRDYAERLVRFHSPAVRIPYYSPFYSEVVYYNHYDWNVYVDGNYAYAFPTWTNRWYDYHYYNSWHRPYSSFNFGWSYGYPYYGGGYYGYGWNHYRPYHAYNHWYNPYYYGYNNYHHHNHYYGGSGYYNRPGSQQAVNRGMRQGLNSDRSTANSRITRNNDALKTGTDQQRSNTSQRGQGTTTRDARGTTTAQNNDRAVRGTVSRPQSETKSTGVSATTGREATRGNYAEGTPTRRSYTPTYSQTEGNTRPVYNRATYTRVSNSPRPAQSTGTVQPRSSTNTSPAQTTGGTRSVQTPTQNRQATPAATQTRQATPAATQSRQAMPATQSSTPVQQRSTTTQPSTGSPTRPAATRSSTPTTYQRGSSTAPTRTSTQSSSAPSRSYSAPAATSSSSSSSYSAPARSSSSGSSSTSGGSSSGSSSGGSSTRGSGGRR